MTARRDPGRLPGSDDRLLRGYGPVLGAVAAFLAMAMIAPTVTPQHLVASPVVGPTAPGATGDLGTAAPDATPSGAGATTLTTHTMGTAGKCPGLQVPNDPYSPPCTTWSGGSNGGATSHSVTATTSTVALRKTAAMDLYALVSGPPGHPSPPPP